MLYGPLKPIIYENVIPLEFNFSIEEPFAWQKCREIFAPKFTSQIDGFYFSHNNENPDSIYKFILKTEEILRFAGVQCETSRMCLTNREYAVWIEPCMFWKKCEFRRSLFTILLRCGTNYKNDYEEALISNSHIRETYSAVKRFLFGYTEYSNSGNELLLSFSRKEYHKSGWVSNFCGLTKDEIKLVLRKSVDGNYSKNFYGIGSIWS